MRATNEKIKGQAPIGQIGEVGKGLTGELCVMMGTVPTKDDEYGDEGVERQEEAEQGEDGRWEEP